MSPTVRRALKARLEKTLSSPMVGRMMRYRVRGKRLILAYHGIVPDGQRPAGERSLFVTQNEFRAQLEILAAIADVVPLEAIDAESTGRPRVAITFDDAYRGAVNEGVRELAERGLPATIFVAPGLLDGQVFWWDGLSEANSTLDDGVRNHALHSLRGAGELVRGWAATIRLPCSDALPSYARTATLDELHAALRHRGLTIGSHSWSHSNLAALSADEVSAEVERSLEWLRATFGARAIPWLAYPYGLDSEEAQRLTAAAGYSGALRIRGGWHAASTVSAFARPRLNIPAGLSLDGFRARVSGVMTA